MLDGALGCVWSSYLRYIVKKHPCSRAHAAERSCCWVQRRGMAFVMKRSFKKGDFFVMSTSTSIWNEQQNKYLLLNIFTYMGFHHMDSFVSHLPCVSLSGLVYPQFSKELQKETNPLDSFSPHPPKLNRVKSWQTRQTQDPGPSKRCL